MTDGKTTEPEEGGAAATQAGEGATEAGEGAPETPPKLHQSVEMTDIGPCKKHIKVTIERGDIDRVLNDKFSKLVVDAAVPGFRPGKAPRKLIEHRFAKDVSNEARGELMLQSLEQLAEENDVAPLSAPEIDPAKINIPDSGPMVYEFEVEVRPQFDLPTYKGLKLKRPVRTFTDADVAEEERRLLARTGGQLVPKPNGKAEVGDYLICDMVTRDGGKVISELKELKIAVEPRLAFKDAVAERFAEQVKGAKAGDKRSVDIALSESAADEKLRGKTLKAELDIKDVKSMRLPELTEEFLEQFGVHTPEQLRERIRVLLDRRLEYLQRQSAREQVLGMIAAAGNWELPQDLLARQARRAMTRRAMEMRAAGMPEEEIRGRLRLLQQDVLQSTALALKEHFVLQKIAEVEKIEINEDDIDAEIERIAYQNDESPRRVRARMEKEDLLEALATELVERKALDLILESAEYEDVPVGKDKDEAPVATVEAQAVPGEMADPAAEAEKQAQETEKSEKSEKS